jgi:peptidoglycan hydrolase CwlO-like protein
VGLATVVSNQNTAKELQQQFKSAIETHFPTGSEARDIWRNEFDLVVSEGQKVSEDLSEQLAASTTHIKNFVENNNEFIDTFKNMREVLATLTQYTNVQRECYSELKTEIANLRNDYKDAQQESLELHKATVKAVEAMTKALKEKDK